MVYRARERARAMYSRPGLRGHPCRFMPRAFVCTRDRIGGIWFDERFWFGPLCELFSERIKRIKIRIIIGIRRIIIIRCGACWIIAVSNGKSEVCGDKLLL